MATIFHLFILIPLLGLIISVLIPGKKEGLLSKAAFFTIGVHFFSAIVFFIYWLLHNHPTLNLKDIVILKTNDYEFYIDFSFDKITAVYLLVGSFLTFLVTVYSRYYLHREEGYKRFFNTILFFYLGYNITIFSGNLETLFIGWEILGISSFLLIAFYRDRYLPVKNAVKVFSIYRIGDIGLILAMWMIHHLFHSNVTFLQLNNSEMVHEHLANHSLIGVFISLMILVTAAAKSAQLPFSSWLPRAMEGPTPSSAIFYGSLSVHIGVFLLLRTFPFWENQTSVRIIIAVLGLSTSIVTTLIARVQSSVKSQIAYASIAQIGLIFIEVAAGFEKLALIHFAGNAFLRTYQLLVSPSVVSYLIKEQFYNYIPRVHTFEDSFPKKLQYSIYMLSLKEWNLDAFIQRYIWRPMHKTGKLLNVFSVKNLLMFFIPAYIIGVISLFSVDIIPESIHQCLPVCFALIGLLFVLKSLTERKNSQISWLLIIMNHFWIALAISFNEHFDYSETLLYISGIVVAGIIGYLCLQRLKNIEHSFDLERFHGHSYEHPKIAFMFFLACLGLSGFPITPTFIGEDVIFSHIHENQIFLALFVSLSLISDGLALIRIYARVFLGPHVKTYHEIAYKSS
jgi:NADH:ubiquinone oxidoreductase subunit 5 (subunit L)/multisubunit Na+/H+ antiporter MnhA subunit